MAEITQQYDAKIKLAAVERELAMRRRVYPRWIAQGRITDGHAAAQISIFEAIAADYRAQVGKIDPNLIYPGKQPEFVFPQEEP